MKILVPIDFTDIAEYGLQVARDIALRNKAEIYLINYIEPIGEEHFSTTGDTLKPDFEAQAYMIELTKRNSQLIHELAMRYENEQVIIKPVIEVDHFEKAMEHFIKEKQIDLVVMGTSGERSFDELIFGNHTEKIIRISNCPVLSVKHYTHRFEPKSMVFAVDLESKDPVEVSNFRDFADWFDATIHFVYVLKSKKHVTDDLRVQLDERAKTYGFRKYTTTIVANRNKEEAVALFAREKHADLIGVATRARNSLVNLFFGSFTEELLKEVDTPALTFSANGKK